MARKVAESGEEEESVTESAANLRRGSVMDRAVRFTQTMAKQLTPHRRLGHFLINHPLHLTPFIVLFRLLILTLRPQVNGPYY